MGHKHHWNPWHGCTKISPGCQNCYMYFLDQSRNVATPSFMCHRNNSFNYPLSKDRKHNFKIKSGERLMVNMSSDTFLQDADPWRDEMWAIIRQRPDVIFYLLTKRPERIASCLPSDWGQGYENVSLNITCENQDMFTQRLPYFQQVPAKHKGLCLAPLISDIDIEPALTSMQIDDVSVGGENYANPRPCDFDWVKHIAETCYKHQTNFIWYETGTHLIKDGKHYIIDSKAAQSEQAYLSGLSKKFNDIVFNLQNPDGTPIKPHTPMYNIMRCIHCANRQVCTGCTECGDCKKVILVNEQDLEFLDSKININIE